MYIAHIDIHVKPEFLEAFRTATIENARNSIQEPGIVRFDFLQQNDDPTHFLLIEVYHSPADVDAHRTTAHYLAWRDTATSMMSEERVNVKYSNIFPADDGWA